MNSTIERKTEASSRCSAWFGANGFVFLDDRPWPYLASDKSGEWWLYYWSHGKKNFVTMRKLALDEVEKFRHYAMSPEKAAFYAPNDRSSATPERK